MPNSIRPLLTKPRQSQLILEGTTTLISVTLLLWLLLWFVHQHPNALKVRAFHVPLAGGHVPYLDADVRGLSRAEGAGGVEAVDVPGLSAKLSDVVGGAKTASVVSISAPLSAEPNDLKPLELIRKIAREARGDVLVVLDLAQVDSDRELGIFGNAPYQGLREQLQKEERPKGKANVVVLCSCAPGQKSWMIDGVGRSAFSYFLQKGLAGAARSTDGRGGKSSLTVDSLYRFVRLNTSQWVETHRRGAIQTPMLLAVGPELKSFSLPPINVGAPEAAAVEDSSRSAPKDAPSGTPSREGASKAAAREAPAPAPGSEKGATREALLGSLLKEWEKHEALEDGERPPYRDAPARWRQYELTLLLAERQVRASWNDPSLRPSAQLAIDSAAAAHGQVVAILKEARAAEEDFPFHPVDGDPRGKEALNASLKYVTGRGERDLIVAAPAPAAAPAGAAVDAGKVEVQAAKDLLPKPLEEAARSRPERYLELQLPAWALRFHEAFGVETFKDGDRGRLLREAVLRRLPAEAALARDRRGLDWIKEGIRAGDEARRTVQDELFAAEDEAMSVARLLERIGAYGKRYVEVSRRIDRYHDARSLFERIAARLPYYGEWAVFEDVRTSSEPGASPDAPAWTRVSAVLKSTALLGAAIEQQAEPADLVSIAEKAAGDFRRVEEEYEGRVGLLASRPGAIPWRDLDDILSTPFIAPGERKSLLEKVIRMETSFPDVVASMSPEDRPGPEPLDPGFLRKSLGLARLEVGLRRLAAGGRGATGPPEEVGRLAGLLDGINPSSGPEADPKAAARILDTFSEVVALVRTDTGNFLSRRRKAVREPGRSEPEVAAELRAADREVRFRADELRRSPEQDPAARDFEAIARRSAIRFHAERLAQDYSRDVETVEARANEAFRDVTAPPVAIPSGELLPIVDPSKVEINLATHLANLSVGVKIEGDGGGDRVPRGKAFVGVLAPKAGADARPRAAADPPRPAESQVRVSLAGPPGRSATAGIAGGLLEIGGEGPRPLAFVVEQLGSVDEDGLQKSLTAKVFYRGRVNEEGQKKVVAVACRNFGPAVVVEISQDRAALARIFSADIAKNMIDQFTLHRTEGYLHARGRLDFILTVRNMSIEPQELIIERVLKPVGEGDAKRPSKPERILIDPRKTFEIRDKLTYFDVPIDKPQQLIVTVTDAKTKATLASEKFTFTQLHLEDYLRIVPDRGPHDFGRNGQLVDSFKIRLIRKAEDPVTEPILYRTIKFSIDEKQPENALPEKGFLDRREADASVVVSYPIRPTDTEFQWAVDVDGELRRDKTKIR